MKAHLIPVLAVAALLALAQAASASSDVLRPTTTAGVNGWTTVPTGTDIAAALADNVTQPAAPNTTTGYVTSPSNGNYWTAVGVAAPTLAQGESITGAGAWAYLATGSTRGATLSVYAGQTLLGWTVVPAGQAARWYSVHVATPPTAAQAANLYVVLVPSGNASTAVTAYAAYVDLETSAPAQAPTSAPPAGDAPGAGAGAGAGADNDATPDGSPAPLAAALAPIAALTAQPSGVVNVPVSCPPASVFGCSGTVAVELLTGSAKKSATAARRRKVVLRAKGRRFKIAAGSKAMVPVVLDRRTARVVRHAGRVRARVTVTTELGGGKTSVSSQTVTVRERRTVRRSAKNTPRGGNGH